jgi:hypothetical protein
MPASRRTKWIIRSIVAAVAAGVVWFGCEFLIAWHRFTSQERICGAFHPVISALGEFQQQNGFLPTNLMQLVPRYLQEIPAAPISDSIEYRVLPDGANWELSVRSRVSGSRALYIQRSSNDFTADEQRQSFTRFHGWLVFREK